MAAVAAPVFAGPLSGQRQTPTTPKPPCGADREPAARAAQSSPSPHASRPTAASSFPAADRPPARRKAIHLGSCRRSTDPQWAPPPAPAGQSESACSSTCRRTTRRPRCLLEPPVTTAAPGRAPSPGHPPGGRPAHPTEGLASRVCRPAPRKDLGTLGPEPPLHRGRGTCPRAAPRAIGAAEVAWPGSSSPLVIMSGRPDPVTSGSGVLPSRGGRAPG